MKKIQKENSGTFVLNIISCENSDWQGQITWIEEQKTTSFRSVLELLKLIDNALNDEDIERED